MTSFSVRLLAAGAVVAVTAAIVAATLYLARPPTRPLPPPLQSVVVVPFRSIAADDQPHLLIGMQEALVMRLGAIPQLRVPSAATVRASEDPFAAAARLGMDAILTGEVQRVGERLRVTVQLSQVPDRRLLWTAQLEDDFAAIFALQDNVAERVAAHLLRRLSEETRAAVRVRETNSVANYELYLRARELSRRRTMATHRAALDLYRQALDSDPNFAAAHAGLADALTTNVSGLPPATRFPRAKAAAERAVVLNPKLASARVSLGYVLYRAEWKFDAAEREFDRAIAIDPYYALAYVQLGVLQRLRGRSQPAIAAFRRAVELDPAFPFPRATLGTLLRLDGRVAEARALLEQGLAQSPNSYELREAFSEVLQSEGRADEAIDQAIRTKELLGDPASHLEALRDAYRRGGRTAYFRKDSEFLAARLARNDTAAVRGMALSLALNAAALGDREQTVRWLEESLARVEEGPISMNLPQFDFVRDHPRFQALHRRVFPVS